MGHPAVAEAAVVGASDETTGQAIVAFVTLKLSAEDATKELEAQDVPPARREVLRRVHLRYQGTDSALERGARRHWQTKTLKYQGVFCVVARAVA